jgi:hypothetical protein
MTLVGRHFVLNDFLCREDAEDEIAIEDGFGAGERRRMEGGGEKSEIKFVEERRGREERTDRQDKKDLVTAQPTEHRTRTRTRNRSLGRCRLHHSASSQPFFAEKKNENMYHSHQQADTTASSNTSHEAFKREQPSFSSPRHQHPGAHSLVPSPRVSTTRASASLPAISSSRTR